MEVEQRSKKNEENKHGAVIAGCSVESETLFWEQKSKFESTHVFIIQICKHHKM